MKISRLLEHHRKFQNLGLPGSMGDGYLMEHNWVYRNLRQAALKLGYKYSAEKNEAFEAFPLLQLEEILKTKTLPYTNNVMVFETLPKAALELLTFEDIDGNLKKNFVFHESCHAVARALSEKHLSPIGKTKPEDYERERTLRMLMEESAANTCELLGTAFVHDPLHRCFYELNSYNTDFEPRTHLKNALNDIGEKAVAKFLFLSYLHSNFLKIKIEEKDFPRIFSLCTKDTLDPKHQKTLKMLSKTTFSLSERFRTQTTSFHLKLAGITTPPKNLFAQDFLKTLEQSHPHQALLQDFAQTAITDNDMPKFKA